jgi:protein-S-isoprenylcysteine O-methyltransferase Ste14
MSITDSDDHPGVLVFPPFLFIGAFLAGLAVHWAWPVQLLPSLLSRVLGAVLLVCALAVAVAAERVMKRAGTNVRPDRPSLALVREGPFRWTRNPLYLSALGLYAGVALLIDAAGPALLFVPLVAVVRWGVIAREEAYLLRKFGDDYRAYTGSVRRWL